MKFFQKRAVAAVVLILAIVAGVVIGQAKKPDTGGQASTAIVGSYTYVYDYAGVLTDETMEHIDAMNASLFAQTGAQILVSVVNSTGGADIMDYASDLGNSYGVGSAERNNGVVMLLALDNISQSGLMGDYCVVVGTGLESHADDFMSLQSYYLENDFAAGEYDAGVKATFDAFIAWFADFYGVTIREGYIPAVRETYSSGSGYYYTETHGYVAPAFGSLVTGQWHYWIYTALTFLVISCPCALVLCVPLSFFAGIGAASKQGILFKGGIAMEQMKHIGAVVFDKTGTITKGNFVVHQVVPADNCSADDVLCLCASAEQASNHPIPNTPHPTFNF